MLTVGKSNIQSTPISFSDRPRWDDGINSRHSKTVASGAVVDSFALEYVKAVRNRAQQQRTYIKSGLNFIEIGDWHFLKDALPRAKSAYLEALKFDDSKYQAYQKLIEVAVSRRDHDDVQRYFEELFKLSGNKKYLHEEASYLLNNLDEIGSHKVKRILNKNLALNKNDTELIMLSGIYLLVTKQLDQAQKVFQQALELEPTNIHAINNSGVVHAIKGEFNEAILSYEAALKQNPSYVTGYENKASLLTVKKEYKKALITLQQAKKLNLNLSEKWEHEYGFLLLRTGPINEAISWYETKTKQEPQNNLLFNNLGKCYELDSKIELAKKNYELACGLLKNMINKSIPFDDRSWHSFHNLMNVYDNLEEDGNLLQLVEFVEKHKSNDWQALFYKGLVSLRSYKYQNAQMYFEKALKINPDSPDVLINLAFIYETVKKNYTKALTLLEKADKLVPKNPAVRNNFAFILIKQGRLNEAKKVLKNLNPNHFPPLFATRGLLALKEDNLSKADINYKKAVQRFLKEKGLVEQIWHTERALYFFEKGDYKVALEEVNIALKSFDSGYSYEDALSTKEAIITNLADSFSQQA